MSSPGLGYVRDAQLNAAVALNTAAFGRSVQVTGKAHPLRTVADIQALLQR